MWFFFLFFRLGHHRFDNTRDCIDTFFPPRLGVHIECDGAGAAGVSHVVACDFQPAHATHKARVHGAEAAGIDLVRQPEFLRRWFKVAMKQVVPVKRIADCVGENEVIWLAKFLVAFPRFILESKQQP